MRTNWVLALWCPERRRPQLRAASYPRRGWGSPGTRQRRGGLGAFLAGGGSAQPCLLHNHHCPLLSPVSHGSTADPHPSLGTAGLGQEAAPCRCFPTWLRPTPPPRIESENQYAPEAAPCQGAQEEPGTEAGGCLPGWDWLGKEGWTDAQMPPACVGSLLSAGAGARSVQGTGEGLCL